jgi:glycine amidinotransferase
MVNSHNEWDQLTEVIVGDGFSSKLPVLDYSFRLFFHDNLWELRDYQFGDEFVTKRHVEEHAEDLDKFVTLLKSLNVEVKRPKVPKKIHKVSTPAWSSTIHPALNVRDMAMIVGDTIIESPPSQRYRYFENQLLSHLFLEYFKQGAKWIHAPKPVMTDNSFDMSYIDDVTGETGYYDKFKSDDHYLDCGHEIMFDAANCIRMGAHILMNVSNENQWLGAKWLQQAVGDKYTVWPVPLTDSHIDSTILPLRPGLAIVMKPDIKDKLPKPLQSWDLIYIPMRNRSLADFEAQNLKLASPRIELNVLSVSPELIICHPQYESELNNRLKKYKIEAIGSPFRHCEIFSGAHHCTTLDVNRKSKYENYF